MQQCCSPRRRAWASRPASHAGKRRLRRQTGRRRVSARGSGQLHLRLPDLRIVDRLHRAGVQVAVTGGHQASFADLAADDSSLVSALAEIGETTDVPMIGTGGVMTGRDAAAVLGAGAIAVQVGTALLCTPEAGPSPGCACI